MLHKRLIQGASLLALMLSVISLGTPAQAAVIYDGRAYGARVQILGLFPSLVTLSDTGNLPPGGGNLSANLLLILIPSTISSGTVNASTTGAANVVNSAASVENLDLLPTSAAQTTASLVTSAAQASCAGASGSSVVLDLVFGGQAVVVTGQPNQTVSIPGVATLIINEQIVGPGSQITVNALHLSVIGVADVIVSSSHAGVDCTLGTEPETWGTVKHLFR